MCGGRGGACVCKGGGGGGGVRAYVCVCALLHKMKTFNTDQYDINKYNIY